MAEVLHTLLVYFTYRHNKEPCEGPSKIMRASTTQKGIELLILFFSVLLWFKPMRNQASSLRK